MKIGILPFSNDLESPGDRRRIAFWARIRGHDLVLDLAQKYDVLFVSERANFFSPAVLESKRPIVFDLIDGYLQQDSFVNDMTRGTMKSMLGELTKQPRLFTKSVAEMCARSSAVICSSVEQQLLIEQFNKNCHIILDIHAEIPSLDFKKIEESRISVFWEGQPATLNPLAKLIAEIEESDYLRIQSYELVSDQLSYRLLGKYFPRPINVVLKKHIPKNSREKVHVNSWDLNNLSAAASRSNLALLPVNLESRFQGLKPENRLLIMWKMGLPVLASASMSHRRVENEIGEVFTCETIKEWMNRIGDMASNYGAGERQVRLGKEYLKMYHTTEILLAKWDKVFETIS